MLFNSENIDLPKDTIIHHCHKICDNYYEKFKDERKRCKLCPNLSDMEHVPQYVEFRHFEVRQ